MQQQPKEAYAVAAPYQQPQYAVQDQPVQYVNQQQQYVNQQQQQPYHGHGQTTVITSENKPNHYILASCTSEIATWT